MNICGERIRKQRLAIDLKQVDFAAALDVDYNIKLDQSDISEIERGTRGVRDYELKAFAEILGVSVEWLIYGKSR